MHRRAGGKATVLMGLRSFHGILVHDHALLYFDLPDHRILPGDHLLDVLGIQMFRVRLTPGFQQAARVPTLLL